MIEGLAAEMFGAGATAHVETERGLGETACITGVTRSFQAMHHNDLCRGVAWRPLRVHQHLHARFCLVESRGHRETLLIQLTAPVIAGDGGEVRIPEEGDEGAQDTILAG